MIKFQEPLLLKDYKKIWKYTRQEIESNPLVTVDMAQDIGSLVIEWDWKHAITGEDLPLPNSAEVIDELTMSQMEELISSFTTSQETLPNSKGDNS